MSDTAWNGSRIDDTDMITRRNAHRLVNEIEDSDGVDSHLLAGNERVGAPQGLSRFGPLWGVDTVSAELRRQTVDDGPGPSDGRNSPRWSSQ